MRHQQRCGHSFAGNVTNGEKERLAIAQNDQFAVIAAYGAHGLVAVLRVPAFQGDVPGRQEL